MPVGSCECLLWLEKARLRRDLLGFFQADGEVSFKGVVEPTTAGYATTQRGKGRRGAAAVRAAVGEGG